MTALELVTLLSQAIYVAIFFLVLWGYVRAPTPAHLDMTIFFGILGFVVVESRIAGLLGVTQPAWFTDLLVALEILVAGSSGQLPDPEKTILNATGQVLGLFSAVGFFVGFAPPAFLRRAWQAPELRNFLERAASLPRLPSTLDIVRELEKGAAAATGSQARIALWQEDDRKLRTWTPGSDEPNDIEAGQHFSGRAFEQQRTIFSSQPIKDDPQGADLYRRGRIGAVVAAPITAGERRLGALVLYAERPPIFAQSDTELANLLADQ